MDKVLMLFRIGLLLILAATGYISEPGSNVVDRSVSTAADMIYAAVMNAEFAGEPVPLADAEDLFIEDDAVPLSGDFSGFGEFSSKLVELVNIEREKAGLGTLTVSELLQTAASVRAAELEQLYSHTRPDGREWATIRTDFSLPGRGAGENLNKNYTTPESCMTSWMNSPDHKTNILFPEWNKVGVAIHEGSDGTMYWAMLFTD